MLSSNDMSPYHVIVMWFVGKDIRYIPRDDRQCREQVQVLTFTGHHRSTATTLERANTD